VIDLAAIGAIAKKAGIPFIVDNTLASPYLCQPKDFGADIIVHSLTKFMGGHGNSIGGVIVDCGTFDWMGSKHRFKTLVEPNASYNGMVLGQVFGTMAFAIAARVMGLRDIGPAISPFNAFLILNGIETLPLRMKAHCENALAVATFLAKHSQVAWVNYAGLPSSPNHAMQQKIAPKGAGAVFTFGLKGGYEAGVKVVAALKLFSHLANIGDTRSLVIHPASTTHRQLTDEQKKSAGAGPDVVRLSVGIEDQADIIADIEQALAGV
jgi:O-acetylhomoserine (thiol)-lyase